MSSDSTPALKISGEIDAPVALTAEAMDAFRPAEKVEDVAKLGSSRHGAGVLLQAILGRVRPKASVRYITFCSPTDDFLASVPIERIAELGVIIYKQDGQPMTRDQGGPFRFIIPNPAACRTDEVDECVNVKFLEEIMLTTTPGRDTRPHDDEAHAKIHKDH